MNYIEVLGKIYRRRSLFNTAAAIALAYSSGTLAANCYFTGGAGRESTINFGSSPINVTVPRDTPIGTVLYEETILAIPKNFQCNTDAPFVFSPNPSITSVTTGYIFALGETGLSLKIHYGDYGYLGTTHILPAKLYNDPARTYRIEILKSSEQSSQNKVPAGYLGAHIYGDLDLVKFNLVNPIILNFSSCQTPDVSVQMGDDYQLHEFSNVGDMPRTIKFNIGLNQCQTGIQKATYSLKATSQVIDQKNGIVALSPSSTAKGIGLKLMNDVGQPIDLGTTYTFNGFNTSGTDFRIPLSAAYYRLAGALEAGNADASVTFTVHYL